MPEGKGSESTDAAGRRESDATGETVSIARTEGSTREERARAAPPAPMSARSLQACAGPDDFDLPDRFEIKRVIGRGGMGVVLEVHDKNLGRDVAVKLLPREALGDSQLRSRFMREARAAGTLHHPGIVTVHDVDPNAGFIVMELIRGESLYERMKREKPLPASEVRRIGVALVRALGAAHAASIVHRDIKPANILLDEDGAIKLVDFGVASFGDSDLTSTGMRIGTPAYMAPEQLRGRAADPRADLYAVGATLFEAATGKRLHADEAGVDDPAQAVREATGDAALAAAIARAVRERPEERFASAAELEAAIAPPRASRAPPPRRGKRAWMLGALAIAVAIAGVAIGARTIVGSAAAPSADRAAAAQAKVETIAVLPFDDTTGDPQLDFTRSGLPYMLDEELGHVQGLKVLGHYRLRDRVPERDASAADWESAARAAGASIVVRGALTKGRAGVHVAVRLERVGSGELLTTLEHDAPAEAITQTVHVLGGEIASVALHRPVAAAQGRDRGFGVERELQLGIAALEEHDLPSAESHLRAALALDPAAAEAHYYMALLMWWQERPEAGSEIESALAGELSDARRGFLQGLRLLVDLDFLPAIDHFRALAEVHPEDRDILYGLTEALYHGGQPGEGIATYKRVVALSPRFRLGLQHALDYYAARDDEEGLAWGLARLEPSTSSWRIWHARTRMARREYKQAIDELQHILEVGGDGTEDLSTYARADLIDAYALSGHAPLALSMLVEADGALAYLTLYAALGDAPHASVWRARAVADLDRSPPSRSKAATWMAIGDYDAIAGDTKGMQEAKDALAALRRRGDPAEPRSACGAAILAGALGDKAGVTEAKKSAFPEASGIGEGFAAEAAGDAAGAAKGWRRAIDYAADGKFLVDEWYFLARAARAAGDRELTIAACENTIEPRVFEVAWAAAVAPCLAWTADAQAALGRTADARATYKRLLALRARASDRDPFVQAATAGLAGLRER